MSDVKQGLGADILARLRGVASGGSNTSQPQPQQSKPTQPAAVVSPSEPQEEKPKRDIQELYDFIDAYCSSDE